MPRRTRRRVLGLLGAAAAGVAGCSGDGPTGPGSDARTPGTSPAGSARAAIRLEPTAPPDDGTVFVYPPALREWLREAAGTGAPVREHATTPVPAPEPPLSAFERVRLTGAGGADGWYDLRAETGIRYEYVATAEAASPPDDATVTPLSALDGDRRWLARAAVDGVTGDAARFYPETELGEWARTEFFGGYVSADGTVYRGRELRQTDAAFFSEQCWYVLSLAPVDGGPGPELRLADLDAASRDAIDGALADRDPRRAVTVAAGAVSAATARLLGAVDALLTHATVFEPVVGAGDG